MIYNTDSIEHQDTVLQNNAQDFQKFLTLNWSKDVSASTSKKLAEASRKKILINHSFEKIKLFNLLLSLLSGPQGSFLGPPL